MGTGFSIGSLKARQAECHPPSMPGNEVFPILQPCTRLPFDEGEISPKHYSRVSLLIQYPDGADPTVFDVKFYPYATDNNDQLFAIVAANVVRKIVPTACIKLRLNRLPYSAPSWVVTLLSKFYAGSETNR